MWACRPLQPLFNCHQAIFSALLTYAKSICLHSPTLGEGFAAHYPQPQPACSNPNQLAEYECDQKDLWKPIFYTSEPHIKKAVKKKTQNLRKVPKKPSLGETPIISRTLREAGRGATSSLHDHEVCTCSLEAR